jgi:putative transcriptional regulator
MSLLKLCFFAMLAVIVGLTVVGRLNRRRKEFDLPKPSTGQHGPALAIAGSSWRGGQPGRFALGQVSVKSEMPLTAFVPVQSRNAEGLGAGKLLVASRDLGDPNFAQTVILLVHYDAQGVVGLVLNRRTNVPLSRVLKDLKAAKDRSDPVYLGGPVEPPTVFALLKSPSKIEGAEPVFGGVYLISAKNLFEQTISTRPDPGVFHVYLGYAGWTKEQLRREVELGSWFIFPADARTVFDSDPDSLWPQMIRKTELKLAGSEPADADPWKPARQLLTLTQGF